MSKNQPRKRRAKAMPQPHGSVNRDEPSPRAMGERATFNPSATTDEDLGRGERPPNLTVGIGASAGGLEALEQLFSHVPAKSGLAYVVVQHLAPEHGSMLAQLLGRRTEMPVVEAKDGMAARADHAYVIAPGTILGIRGGSFQVASIEAERHGQIDAFLRSLAVDQAARAVGIVLSGSGTDGTVGLRAVKERGGLTLAQTPETAKYDTMPKSAIGAGVVDHVLLPEEMPAKLLERAKQVAEGRVGVATPAAAAPAPGTAGPSDEQVAAALDRIYPILQRRTGHDFSHYKRGTVLRRLRRRLQLRRSPSLDEYVDFLGKDAQEPELLAKDLLIGVTQFFRDPEAFEHLGLHVLRKIIAAGSADEGVRIWVPGCASGEEAYSIGILMRERLDGVKAAPLVQIFATDIDAEAIAEARQARYPADIAEHVSPERLARFFARDGATFQVSKELREMCVFSEHSLIRDPPFLRLDLISCRNLLIYLDTELQKKLLPVFHYALNRGGFLFLGPSESLAEHPELFETVDKRFRVFRRVESLTRPLVEFPLVGRMAPRVSPPPPQASAALPTQTQVVNTAFERLMLQEYGPPGAVVNERGDVICVAGLTGSYLQPPAGILTTNILDIAHASLRIELRTALHASARSGKRVVRDDVQVEVNGSPRRLRLTVRPLPGVKQDGLFAVILQERTEGTGAEAAEPAEPSVGGGESASAMEQLESELRTTRANLRATIEELESANEELKSSNEELLSTNEEMQSTNEELQSSQEELKSVNEELATVNAELSRKVDDLDRANSDLQNFFSSTDVATLFLDRELRVAKFTPAAKALFRLIEADLGRPIADLAPRLAGQNLAVDVDEVLRTLRPVERPVETIDRQAWYLLRVLPYRTAEDVIAGAVVTLADITGLKQAESDLRRLATVVMDSNDAVTVQDLEGRVLAWNRGAERMYGYSADEARQLTTMVLVPEEGRGEARGFLEAIKRGEEVTSLEVKRRTKDGQALDVSLTVTKLVDDQGRPIAVATTERDVTERNRREASMRAAAEQLRRSIEDAPIPVIMHAEDGEVLQLSRSWTELTGYTREDMQTIDAWLNRAYGEGGEEVRNHVRALFGGNRREREVEVPIRTRDGRVRQWSISASSPGTLQDGRRFVVAMAVDITERKQAEQALLSANERLLEADRRKNEFLAMLSHELRNPLAPIRNSLFILDRAAPGGEQAQRAQAVIERQVGHMTRLIEDLLDVTRITRGKIQLQLEVLDLNELTLRTVEDHRGAFVASEIELQVMAAPAEVRVNGDRTRLAQVVGNLLQNAAKFTQRGGKTTVSVQADATGGRAIVRVQDTGKGIPPQMLPRLFEAFAQADATLDRKKGGLGLGLALAKGLVEMHGGTVSAASDGPGEGATFTITLPLTTIPAKTDQPGAEAGIAVRRVLVIEDNVDAAESLREALELGGHEVEVAYNGPEGIEEARSFGPDVVLCDIGLPEMDGYQVARAMRADPELCRVTLVALTGYAGPEDVAKAEEAGFDAHLAKPPSMEAVERVLQSLP